MIWLTHNIYIYIYIYIYFFFFLKEKRSLNVKRTRLIVFRNLVTLKSLHVFDISNMDLISYKLV
jgi:hypothetical protein